jgi:hypothetical protein
MAIGEMAVGEMAVGEMNEMAWGNSKLAYVLIGRT